MTRTIGWVLAGMLFVGAVPFAISGCGHSLEGDCENICTSTCQAVHDCAIYNKVTAPDLDQCRQKCATDCPNTADQINSKCNHNVDIHGDVIDKCVSSVNQLASACRDNKASAVLDAQKLVSDSCYLDTTKYYSCN